MFEETKQNMVSANDLTFSEYYLKFEESKKLTNWKILESRVRQWFVAKCITFLENT